MSTYKNTMTNVVMTKNENDTYFPYAKYDNTLIYDECVAKE